jgi:hypothetical protein
MGEWMYSALPLHSLELEWSASCPGRFTLGERAPDTHWLGRWVDPRAGLDHMEK